MQQGAYLVPVPNLSHLITVKWLMANNTQHPSHKLPTQLAGVKGVAQSNTISHVSLEEVHSLTQILPVPRVKPTR